MDIFNHPSPKKPGSSPEHIEFVGEQKTHIARMRLIRYDGATLEEKEFDSIESCLESRHQSGIKWINIDGLHDVTLLKQVGQAFDIHQLVLEDIVNTAQRPKIDVHDDHIYVVLKIFYIDKHNQISAEQMSFVLGQDYVLSFQEQIGDVFEQVRMRLRSGASSYIRKHGADYLLYALIDAVVDHYFVILEKLGDTLEDIDEELSDNPTSRSLKKIHEIKKQVVFLRKSTWPLREMFGTILRTDTVLINEKTEAFFRDVQDHTIQILDSLESFREIISSMTELYQSTISNKMNEIMKVLTIIATVFIPPTFVVGLYGMNFENMPELHTESGYFVVLGIIAAGIFAMFIYFKNKRWI